MHLPRALLDAVETASRQFRALLLCGPRQVGKTTLLRRLAGAKRRYVTLDDPASRELARRDPALFLERFSPPVLIDEIQYAPQLLPLIKIAVDSGRRGTSIWLTGSQQFHLMRGVSETLAGRVAILNLLGLSSRERRRRNLDLPPFLPTHDVLRRREADAPRLTLRQTYRDIWLGGFPALVTRAVRDRDLFFSSYVQTYLQRDVRDLARVGDEAAFLRFVKSVAARTAQLLNLSDLARDADISVNTAKTWLSILQTSFQVILLPPYYTNVTKRLVKMPKLYFLDTGLCAYLTDWSSPDTLEAGAMSGAVFETHVVAEILKSWWNAGKQPNLYYYRDKDGREVDLLIAQDRGLYAIEIKKSSAPRVDAAAAFDALRRLDQPLACGGIVCMINERLPLTRTVELVPLSLL
ncbi:hypothetical protein RAS1_00940 [Phycisphaerae bacterium RAS1]|nr:hypothetical protein RAS1_00940 [Phycisphaerae bacterium RAS1]